MQARSLLFSLLAVPACGASVSEDDPSIPSGGSPEDFDDTCREYLRTAYACYEQLYSAEETDVDIETTADTYCALIRTELDDFGSGCLGAFEEIFACVASLDCETLAERDEGAFDLVPEPCRAVYRDAAERCPDGVPACAGVTYGVGTTAGCDITGTDCIDGHTYGIRCAPQPDDAQCDCVVDDEVVRRVARPTDPTCLSDAWLDDARAACGFPVRAF